MLSLLQAAPIGRPFQHLLVGIVVFIGQEIRLIDLDQRMRSTVDRNQSIQQASDADAKPAVFRQNAR